LPSLWEPEANVALMLVVRQVSRTDRRIKQVVLTEAGNRLYDTVKAVAADVRKDLLARIDRKTLAVATELLEALQKVIENTP